eukprot:7133156-Pyramimonas_sp.AAC.1
MAPIDLEQPFFTKQADLVLADPSHVTFRGGTGTSTIDFFCLSNATVRGHRGVHSVMSRHKKAHHCS